MITVPTGFFLPGAGGGVSGIAYSYLGSATMGGSGPTYVLPSVDFGEADENRHIIIGTGARSGMVRPVISASIGGISASRDAVNSVTAGSVAIIRAAVPTGVSGEVSLTYQNTMNGCIIHVYRVIAPSLTVVDSLVNTSANGVSNFINNTAGGLVIGNLIAQQGASDQAWTGLTERAETIFGTLRSSSAADLFDAAATGREIIVNDPDFQSVLALVSYS